MSIALWSLAQFISMPFKTKLTERNTVSISSSRKQSDHKNLHVYVSQYLIKPYICVSLINNVYIQSICWSQDSSSPTTINMVLKTGKQKCSMSYQILVHLDLL